MDDQSPVPQLGISQQVAQPTNNQAATQQGNIRPAINSTSNGIPILPVSNPPNVHSRLTPMQAPQPPHAQAEHIFSLFSTLLRTHDPAEREKLLKGMQSLSSQVAASSARQHTPVHPVQHHIRTTPHLQQQQQQLQSSGQQYYMQRPVPIPPEGFRNKNRLIPIICNGNKGTFYTHNQGIVCHCSDCRGLSMMQRVPSIVLTPTEFERHSGMGNSKKWKYTLRVLTPSGKESITLGDWLDDNGIIPHYTKNIRDPSIKGPPGIAPGISDLSTEFPAGPAGGIHRRIKGPTSLQGRPPMVVSPPTILIPPPTGTPNKAAHSSLGKEEHTILGLRSPSGTPWLAGTREYSHTHPRHEDTSCRLGLQFQAAVDAQALPRPREFPADPREGEQTISEEEALAYAAGPERVQALGLPKDAIADLWVDDKSRSASAASGGQKGPTAIVSNAAAATKRKAQPVGLAAGEPPTTVKVAMKSPTALVEAGEAGTTDAPLRTKRNRKQPSWMRSTTLDPAIADNLSRKPEGGMEAALPPAKKVKQTDDARGEAIDAALKSGRVPCLMSYKLDDGLKMHVKMQLGGVIFQGTLLPGAMPQKPPTVVEEPPPPMPIHRGERPTVTSAEKESIKAEKQAAYEREFAQLVETGPRPGTRCTLCRKSVVDEIPDRWKGSGGRSQKGLGQLLLIRMGVNSHTWVHDQCLRWSPEVYDPEGNDVLEGVKDAIRRGRMIKCRLCGEKGATLGCMKKTCRHSYHLPCARKYHILLQNEPYRVACPEHIDQLEERYEGDPGYEEEQDQGTHNKEEEAGGEERGHERSPEPWRSRPPDMMFPHLSAEGQEILRRQIEAIQRQLRDGVNNG